MAAEGKQLAAGTIVLRSVVFGPFAGALVLVAWFVIAAVADGSIGAQIAAVPAPSADTPSFLLSALGLCWLIGAFPSLFGGLFYAGLRRAFGERARTAAFAAFVTATPIALWAGVSAEDVVGLAWAGIIVCLFVASGVLTWAVVLRGRRRRG